MDRLYLMDCSPLLNEDCIREVLPQLDNTRRQRIEQLKTPEKRAQCAAAGLLLTRLFGENNAPPSLFHGSRGKPYLYEKTDVFFSLSHVNHWVLCATASAEIGADAQPLTDYRPHVANRCFTEAERAWMEKLPEERFAQLWTAKEAYLKYTGFGLVLPMSSFSVPCPAIGQDDVNHCHWWSDTVQDLAITVCSAEKWMPSIEYISL